jgi:pSer/pThr/pTyr-binding forkhead associated (FHA) protein
VIQFHILSGKQAGSDIVVRHFPFTIGRAGDMDARFEDTGVWERHCEIDFRPKNGFEFSAQPEAPMLVNGERVNRGILRNGDVMEIGSVQLRFWLARSRQKSLRFREALTWSALIGLFLAQGALIYCLLAGRF